jgi:signal transduction histidine kinase
MGLAANARQTTIACRNQNREPDDIRVLPRDPGLNIEHKNLVASNLAWKSVLLLAISCMALSGCRAQHTNRGPHIEFTIVPLAEEGGPEKLDVIEGRVIGAQPELQIVLFARSGDWYVQPVADQPFTQIQVDSKWRSSTHLGTEYAALLIEPGYQPPSSTAALPGEGGGVIAVAVVKGEPVFWQRWWFLLLCVLACLSALLAFYSYRLHQGTRQLNLRFEERLAERTRVAQELHDTLLQGVISASMQLHIAVDRLPEDLPERASLAHVLHVMGQVVEEGRSALKRLSSSASSDSLDVEQAFSRIRQEFAVEDQIGFRVTVEGRPRPVHPIIRDEVYRIGREALLNAFRHSRAERIEVEVEYKARYLRVVIRDDGCAIDPQVLRSVREDHCGLSGMREHAHGIGARLRVRSREPIGTEVELSVPGNVAFQSQPSNRSLLRWLARWYPRNTKPGTTEAKKGESK